ncbi:MAG TPA: hypothetical protein VEH48_02515, partial [Candidatus Nitrosopolaris sp.]|nr:hypothetical protein [Candidatus Nitrosopolaris sp.]
KFGWLELFKAVDPESVKDLWTPTPKVVSDVIAECFELNIATARVLLSELPPSLREKPSFACLNDFLQQPELQP